MGRDPYDLNSVEVAIGADVGGGGRDQFLGNRLSHHK